MIMKSKEETSEEKRIKKRRRQRRLTRILAPIERKRGGGRVKLGVGRKEKERSHTFILHRLTN